MSSAQPTRQSWPVHAFVRIRDGATVPFITRTTASAGVEDNVVATWHSSTNLLVSRQCVQKRSTVAVTAQDTGVDNALSTLQDNTVRFWLRGLALHVGQLPAGRVPGWATPTRATVKRPVAISSSLCQLTVRSITTTASAIAAAAATFERVVHSLMEQTVHRSPVSPSRSLQEGCIS